MRNINGVNDTKDYPEHQYAYARLYAPHELYYSSMTEVQEEKYEKPDNASVVIIEL